MNATYNELQNQLRQLQAKLEEVTKRARADAIADIRRKMQEYGIDASELGSVGKKRGKAAATKGGNKKSKAGVTAKKSPKSTTAMHEVRFRDPASGATWSGRGRPPRWLEGKQREQFAVTH